MHSFAIKIINLVLKSPGKKVVVEVDLRYSKSYFKHTAVVCNYLFGLLAFLKFKS